MKTTYNWLAEYLPDLATMPVEDLAHSLTMAGLAVESVTRVGEDFVLDLEITSNRGDLQGMAGIAREVRALTGFALKLPETDYEVTGRPIAEQASVAVPAPKLCPRYTARLITDVKVGPSPSWLASRLETLGFRSVNNVVDITNLVMLETGQPLHAFDLARLAEGKIIVRRAVVKETITLIDGTIQELTRQDLVIADAQVPVAIAGVMGGLASEVTTSTSVILLESARFSPPHIRRTSRRLGVGSESSYRFERGIDPEGVDWASRRATRLISELTGGKPAPGVIDVNFERLRSKKIRLRAKRIETLLGVKVALPDAIRMLEALDFSTVSQTRRSATFLVPSFRPDVSREIDLIEEVARVFGYDKIPTSTSIGLNLAAESKTDVVEKKLRSLLLGAGLSEVVTYSLVDERSAGLVSCWSDSPALALSNPTSEDNKFLRKSQIPNLLKVAKTNQYRGAESINVFEMGSAYLPRPGAKQPEERKLLTLLSDRPDGFYYLKGVLEELLSSIGLESLLQFAPGAQLFLLPHSSARMELNGEVLGWLGCISSNISEELDLALPPAVAELDLGLLLDKAHLYPSYSPLPRYPSSSRDIALVLEEKVLYRDVLSRIQGLGIGELEKVKCFDVYRGEQVPAGKKSLAFRLTFRSRERTLTSSEVAEFAERIVKQLENELGAQLRRL